jgi:beta-lactamase regulating signal transducer with metallopeptidase domain
MNSQLPEALLPLLADAAVGSTVILLAACVVTAALARSSAARRHWVWTLALFALLALPVLSVVLAPWSLHIAMPDFARADGNKRADAPLRNLDRALPALNEEALKPLLLAGQDPGPQVEPGPARGAAVPASAVPELPLIMEDAAPAPASWVVRVWLAGTALALCGLALGVVSLACLHRRCRPATEALGCLAAELSRELGIRRTVRLRLTAVRSMPMTWGILRPVVVLPDDAERWSSERQRLVLLHELAHVQRWDCLSQWLGHVARAVYWFQPLAWFALARLRAEQEHACDDVVLGHGAAAADYSEHLVAVTAGKATPLLGAHVALAISRSTRLHNRIRALLDPRRDRRPWRLPALVATTLCALLAASAAALLTLTPAAHAVQKPAEEAGKKDAAAPVPPTEGELLKKIAEIQRKLKEGYVEATDEKRLAAAAVRGLLDGLDDPYTSYLPADDLEQFKSQQQGALTGIGAQLTLVDGRVAVVTPLDDSPALKAGVRPGDIIDAVDGKPVREIKDAVQRILGPKGSEVKLKVIRPSGAVQEITITRGVVRLASALGFRRAADGRWSYELDPEQRIAYVRIQQFQKDTARELADAVMEEQD